jgi:hypothetical protein
MPCLPCLLILLVGLDLGCLACLTTDSIACSPSPPRRTTTGGRSTATATAPAPAPAAHARSAVRGAATWAGTLTLTFGALARALHSTRRNRDGRGTAGSRGSLAAPTPPSTIPSPPSISTAWAPTPTHHAVAHHMHPSLLSQLLLTQL